MSPRRRRLSVVGNRVVDELADPVEARERELNEIERAASTFLDRVSALERDFRALRDDTRRKLRELAAERES